jgi:hypothetical protein
MTGNAVYDATLNGTYTPANPLIRCKNTPALDLDGVAGAGGNYLSLANPISGLTAFSIVFWVNIDANDGMPFSRAGAAGTYMHITGANTFGAQVASSGPLTAQKFPISRTYMLVFTRDTTPVGRIFLDGKFLIQAATGVNPVDANAFIGQYWNGSFRLNGRLDNIQFWNIALSQEQIQSIRRSSEPRM